MCKVIHKSRISQTICRIAFYFIYNLHNKNKIEIISLKSRLKTC